MPIVVRITDGLVPPTKEQQLMFDLINLFLNLNGAADNAFLRANFIGEYRSIPSGRSFVGDAVADMAAVELKVPTLALQTTALRRDWVSGATSLVVNATDRKLSKEKVWVNLVYGDGMWGIAGEVYSDDSLDVKIKASALPA